MSKKILLFTDSLGLPREQPEFCLFNDTWPSLLKKHSNYNIHQVSIGGATITDLEKQIYYHKLFNPDCIIFQVGIVDCAPRFMSQGELNFFKKLRKPGKAVIRLMNKKTVRKIRGITYTSQKKFKIILQKINDQFAQKEIYFIGILPASDVYEKQLPGIQKNVEKYNELLASNQNFIPMDAIPSGGIMSDYHHLTKQGHQFVYDTLLEVLN